MKTSIVNGIVWNDTTGAPVGTLEQVSRDQIHNELVGHLAILYMWLDASRKGTPAEPEVVDRVLRNAHNVLSHCA